MNAKKVISAISLKSVMALTVFILSLITIFSSSEGFPYPSEENTTLTPETEDYNGTTENITEPEETTTVDPTPIPDGIPVNEEDIAKLDLDDIPELDEKGNIKEDESEYQSTSNMTGRSFTKKKVPKKYYTPGSKCDFLGTHGIKDDCDRYMFCSDIGSPATVAKCPSGKHYDLVKRNCFPEGTATCVSMKVCPNDSYQYADPGRQYPNPWYLHCKDGVPLPRQCSGNWDNGCKKPPQPKPPPPRRRG